MMLVEVDTAHLMGPALDWAIALGAGLNPRLVLQPGGVWAVVIEGMDQPYSPSTNWSQGGPLLEEYSNGVIFNGDNWIAEAVLVHHREPVYGQGRHPTLKLVAFCRALATALHGDKLLLDSQSFAIPVSPQN